MKKGICMILAMFICLSAAGAALAGGIWYCPNCGRKNDSNFCPNDGVKKPEDLDVTRKITPVQTDTSSELDLGGLSPSNKCIVRPMIYSARRYKDSNKETAYNLKGDFSATTIKNQLGTRQYGLYFKFTPSGKDNGYDIYRFDVVINDPTGEAVYTEGFDTEMTCQAGYYWYWNFFSLDACFRYILDTKGKIRQGYYDMDIYFNRQWAGETAFRVIK